MKSLAGWIFGVMSACLGAACGGAAEPSDTGNPGLNGKADDMWPCPEQVGINSAAGSQRRCYDLTTGEFVPAGCCGDLCRGAAFRVQGEKTRCTWTGERGLEDTRQARFAPRMCCRLNDRLACARGVLEDSRCLDPENPLKVLPPVCCGQNQGGCHPEDAWALQNCTWNLLYGSEWLSWTPLEALEICADQGDYPQACLEDLRPEYDCVFGLTYQDIFRASSRIVVAKKQKLTPGNLETLSSVQRQQLLRSVQESACEVATLQEAIAAVDRETVHYHELWEGSNGRAYQSYEFGVGGDSYGAIFGFGTPELAARIHDGDLYDGTPAARAGCGIPSGPRWTDCRSDAECAPGLLCLGQIEHRDRGRIGRCVDPDLGAGAGPEFCSATRPCPLEAGLICSGLTRSDGGYCRPAWMTRMLQDPEVVRIPDDDQQGVQREISAYGLAAVGKEVVIDLDLEHPDFSQLLITLHNPAGQEGSIEVVFDGSNPAHLAALGETDGWAHISRPCFLSGDEDINGSWTLRVVDRARGQQGILHGWTLLLRSRWD